MYGAPMPHQITVHVFDSKGKGKDKVSDMLSGKWSDTVEPCQLRGDYGKH